MEAPKSLRRPTNWQDFESLCKKLWGEIWNCPEIKKNGRAGQLQNGVDIFGIPKNEISYYGIQCKGKDEYSAKQFTEKEIISEINKAKDFEPKLKKLYLTTTAIKDSKIEAFIRKKNIENKINGLFEIHLFCWEDIVDLIDENRQTHDWYVKNQKYKNTQKAILTFQDDSLEKNITVKFQQTTTEYRQRIPSSIHDTILANPLFNLPIHNSSWGNNSINYSFYDFSFRLHNSGEDPIENFKIFFSIEGEFLELVRIANWSGMILPKNPIPYDTFLSDNGKSGKISPSKSILVSEDSISFDDLRIKPRHESSNIIIKWKLVSKNYKTDGELKINFTSEIIKKNKTVLITDSLKNRIEIEELEDYIEKKN